MCMISELPDHLFQGDFFILNGEFNEENNFNIANFAKRLRYDF